MKHLIALAFALYAVPVYGHTESITLSVEFKVTDQNNIPLSGEPTRITFAGEDWQSPDAGERLVTDASGAAQFVVVAEIDKRTKGLLINNRIGVGVICRCGIPRVTWSL
jgi:hypothetical protein